MLNYVFRRNGDRVLIKYRSVRRALEKYMAHDSQNGRCDYLGENGVMPYTDPLDIHSMPDPERSILYVGRNDFGGVFLEESMYYIPRIHDE